MAANKKSMNQGEFAQFLEENAGMFTEPKGADLLELILSLEGRNHADIKEAFKLQSGAIKVNYTEEVVLKGVASNREGNIELPSILKVAIALFRGRRELRSHRAPALSDQRPPADLLVRDGECASGHPLRDGRPRADHHQTNGRRTVPRLMSFDSKNLPQSFLRRMEKSERKPLGKAGILNEEAQALADRRSERQLQEQVAALCRQRNLFFIQSRMDKATTVKKGLFDFTIFYPS